MMMRGAKFGAAWAHRVVLGVLALALVLTASAMVTRSQAAGGEEGGIGGTGIYFGQITAFSSIIMNGERIALPASVGVGSVPGMPQPTVLLPGDTVFVTTRGTESGPVAERIVRFFPIVGPVDWSRSSRQSISIMGTTVRAGGAVITTADGLEVSWSSVPREAVIAVNGIWQNAEILATRLVVLPAGAPAALSGLVVEQDGALGIGGTGLAAGTANPLTFATITGAAQGSALAAQTVEIGLEPYAPFDAVARLSASAILSPDPDGQGFHLSGFGIPMDPRSQIPAETGVLRVFTGTFDERFLITDAQ